MKLKEIKKQVKEIEKDLQQIEKELNELKEKRLERKKDYSKLLVKEYKQVNKSLLKS